MSSPSPWSRSAADYQQRRLRPTRFAAACLVLALLPGLAAGPAAAGITAGSERATPAAAAAGTVVGGVAPSLEGRVTARCWQSGREILSEGTFAAAAIPPELRERSVSLDGGGRSAVLLPFADTFCLLTVAP